MKYETLGYRLQSRKFLVTLLAIGIVVAAQVTGAQVADVAVAAVAASGVAYVAAEAIVDVARSKADVARAAGQHNEPQPPRRLTL